MQFHAPARGNENHFAVAASDDAVRARLARAVRRIVAIKPWLTLARVCAKAMRHGKDSVRLIQPFVNKVNPKARLRRRSAAWLDLEFAMFAATFARTFPLVAALAFGLALGACARNNADSDALNGAYGAAGAPAACRSSRRASATACSSTPTPPNSPRPDQATLDKQAAWLNQYNRYTFTIEGHADERGTREYNFALGARRAEIGQELSDRQGRRGRAHQDDQLRQGAPGGGLQRHLLLVAEPPRRHRARGRGGKLTGKHGRAARGPRLRLTFGRPLLVMLSEIRARSGERRRAVDGGPRS